MTEYLTCDCGALAVVQRASSGVWAHCHRPDCGRTIMLDRAEIVVPDAGR